MKALERRMGDRRKELSNKGFINFKNYILVDHSREIVDDLVHVELVRIRKCKEGDRSKPWYQFIKIWYPTQIG